MTAGMDSTLARVVAFTAGVDDPSSRFRIRQYQRDLEQCGIALEERFPAMGSAYPPPSRWARLPWLASQLAQRASQVWSSREFDLTVLQRQMVSTINTLERWTGRPRLLDVDDAIWLKARFRSADRLAARCDGVICGNDWLAEHFSSANAAVHIVPTAVDTRRWAPVARHEDAHAPVIGWMGTGGNLPFVYGIEDALREVLAAVPAARLLIVSDCRPQFVTLDPKRVTSRRWDPAREVTDMHDMTVGLMPLADTPWAQGKCSFKMLQYMACGIPAVVSPVGMNRQVAAKGGAITASTTQEWSNAIVSLCRDPGMARSLGAQGRAVVERDYATETIAKQLAGIYRRYVWASGAISAHSPACDTRDNRIVPGWGRECVVSAGDS
jgi:glycosyltransferase involved in cell wall biosynthesis